MEAEKSESDSSPLYASNVISEDSMHSEVFQKRLKDTLYFENLLLKNSLITSVTALSINEEAMGFGHSKSIT